MGLYEGRANPAILPFIDPGLVWLALRLCLRCLDAITPPPRPPASRRVLPYPSSACYPKNFLPTPFGFMSFHRLFRFFDLSDDWLLNASNVAKLHRNIILNPKAL